jgi:DNA-directed RNA polymerase subunit F
MVVTEERPLMISEVHKLIKDSDKEEEIKTFLSKFGKIGLEKDLGLKKRLEELDILKLKDRHIVKIVDFKPDSIIELNKIVSDISLDSEESNNVLNVIRS